MKFLLLLCLAVPALCHKQRIIGGSNANIATYPYTLSLRIDGAHECGAALISTTRAVTAAHCSGSALDLYSILGGGSDRSDTECAFCVLRQLNQVTIHPGFDENEDGFPNDIAVLGFAPLSYNSNLQPIDIAHPDDGDLEGEVCFITGWGRTTSSGSDSEALQQAQVTIITNRSCSVDWGILNVNDGHICASDENASPCSGDIGSPLNCLDKLAGVMSWGHSTCNPSWPSVFTRVSDYYDWIILQRDTE